MKKDSLRNTSATDNARKGIRDREDKQCSDEFCYKRDWRNGAVAGGQIGVKGRISKIFNNNINIMLI